MNKIIGQVKPGDGLGKTIGYPTINVIVEAKDYESGVYVCEVKINEDTYYGAGYVGEKAGLAPNEYVCEVYLFEDCGDVYFENVEIVLLERIRDAVKVNNLEELKPLIEKDVEYAKDYLNTRK